MDTHGQIHTNQVWKEISGFPDYLVSDNGNVVSRKTGDWKLLRNVESAEGYAVIVLYVYGRKSGKNFLVHRLVAMSFLTPPSEMLVEECKKTFVGKPIVNHKDNDRFNNNARNLEWCTFSHNNEMAYKTGGRVQKSGDEYHLSKLNAGMVVEIIDLIDAGVSHKAIADMFGVKRNAISSLNNGYSWSHITGREKKVQKRRAKTVSISE